ncbi:MAG: FlgD immunoglobulin-like domain containing protein [Candidatus Marinimicrobia bacterium]|nr:FlgD immunoglobulin-like domain containing protein [Candidatus Neomarinimicrobiota bacterium]
MQLRHLIYLLFFLGLTHFLSAGDSEPGVVFSNVSLTRSQDGMIYVVIDSEEDIAALQFSLEYDHNKVMMGKPAFFPDNQHFSIESGGDSSLMKVIAFSLGGRLLDTSDPVLKIPLSALGDFEGAIPLNVREFIASDPNGNKVNLKVSAGKVFIVPTLPRKLNFSQNFSSFSRGEPVIKLDLPEAALVNLAIYDVKGKKVRMIEEREILEAGFHSITWDGTDAEGQPASAGEYVCSLKVGANLHTMKMVLLR